MVQASPPAFLKCRLLSMQLTCDAGLFVVKAFFVVQASSPAFLKCSTIRRAGAPSETKCQKVRRSHSKALNCEIVMCILQA